MLMMDLPATIYNTVEKAQAVATALTDGDEDGWTYVADPDPKGSGRAIIKIYDEDGEFIANWSG